MVKFPLSDDHFQGGSNLTGPGDEAPTLPRILNELNGRAYSNTTRPAANTVPAGTQIFNVDDKAPNWSDGTNWRDALGNLT